MSTRDYPTGKANAPTLVFGPGAGAGHDHAWIRRVAGGLATRGVRVVTFDFPYRIAGKSVPDKPEVLEDAFRAIWDQAASTAGGQMFAGGKSMGGRISSQAAARGLFAPAASGLVFFGYPLHPPGKPAQRRDKHLPSVGAPMLFLSGTRDPFGSPDEFRELVTGLPQASLEIVEGGDHSLVVPKKQDPQGANLDRVMDIAARWMLSV